MKKPPVPPKNVNEMDGPTWLGFAIAILILVVGLIGAVTR